MLAAMSEVQPEADETRPTGKGRPTPMRSEAQKTGSGVAPRWARASQSVSTKAVLPDSSCAR